MKRFVIMALLFSVVFASVSIETDAQRSCNNANPRGKHLAKVHRHKSRAIKLRLRKHRQQQRAAKSTQGYLQ